MSEQVQDYQHQQRPETHTADIKETEKPGIISSAIDKLKDVVVTGTQKVGSTIANIAEEIQQRKEELDRQEQVKEEQQQQVIHRDEQKHEQDYNLKGTEQQQLKDTEQMKQYRQNFDLNYSDNLNKCVNVNEKENCLEINLCIKPEQLKKEIVIYINKGMQREGEQQQVEIKDLKGTSKNIQEFDKEKFVDNKLDTQKFDQKDFNPKDSEFIQTTQQQGQGQAQNLGNVDYQGEGKSFETKVKGSGGEYHMIPTEQVAEMNKSDQRNVDMNKGDFDVKDTSMGISDVKDTSMGYSDVKDTSMGTSDVKDTSMAASDIKSSDKGNVKDSDKFATDIKNTDLKQPLLQEANQFEQAKERSPIPVIEGQPGNQNKDFNLNKGMGITDKNKDVTGGTQFDVGEHEIKGTQKEDVQNKDYKQQDFNAQDLPMTNVQSKPLTQTTDKQDIQKDNKPFEQETMKDTTASGDIKTSYGYQEKNRNLGNVQQGNITYGSEKDMTMTKEGIAGEQQQADPELKKQQKKWEVEGNKFLKEIRTGQVDIESLDNPQKVAQESTKDMTQTSDVSGKTDDKTV
jgi:hypothetical protein